MFRRLSGTNLSRSPGAVSGVVSERLNCYTGGANSTRIWGRVVCRAFATASASGYRCIAATTLKHGRVPQIDMQRIRYLPLPLAVLHFHGEIVRDAVTETAVDVAA